MNPILLILTLGCTLPAHALAEPPAVDDPQISRSRGEAGGVVVLWTRVIPRTDDPAITAVAASIQSAVATSTARLLPGRATDRRPAPERVCPRAGCLGVAASALLLHRGEGCAVVLLVSRPGQSELQVVPWVGRMTLSAGSVPFREPPETLVRVSDFQKCERVAALLAEPAPAVDAALSDAAK